MLIGILSALLAGAMLGLYALPGKYVKDFQEENKWSLLFQFALAMLESLRFTQLSARSSNRNPVNAFKDSS